MAEKTAAHYAKAQAVIVEGEKRHRHARFHDLGLLPTSAGRAMAEAQYWRAVAASEEVPAREEARFYVAERVVAMHPIPLSVLYN